MMQILVQSVWKKWLRFNVLSLSTLLTLGCAGNLIKISSRIPHLQQARHLSLRANGKKHKPGETFKPPRNPALYIKESRPIIREHGRIGDHGSLYSPDNNAGFFFLTRYKPQVGEAISVLIDRSNLIASNKAPSADKSGDDENLDSNGKGKSELLDRLEKLFPDLKPKTDGTVRLVESLPMTISHIHPNGDVSLRYHRSSQSDGEDKSLTVEARVSADVLDKEKDISSTNLHNIEFLQANNGKMTRRESTQWEDEYTLRLAGFSEARSEEAQRLTQVRKDLQRLGEDMRQKIIAHNRQQRTQAKERDVLVKDRQDDRQAITSLKEKIDEQQTTITEQKQTINELQNVEEKPSDENDGADGG